MTSGKPKRSRPKVSRQIVVAESLEPRFHLSAVNVTNLNDSGAGSLRQAIIDAITYDTITFQPGLTGTITLNSVLNIEKPLSIIGPGATLMTIHHASTAPASPVIMFSNGGFNLSGVTISGGNNAGLAFTDGIERPNVTLDGVVVTSNSSAVDGGGIWITHDSSLTIRNSTISANTAPGGAGILVSANTSFLIENSTISGNNATSSSSGGGGLYLNNDRSTIIRNCTISNNSSAGAGGGIQLGNFTSTLTIQDSTIANNTTATVGGGISAGAGSLSIQNTTVSGNSAPGGGGGIARLGTAAGAITVTNSIVSGNLNSAAPDISASSATTTKVNSSAIGNANGFVLGTGSNNNLPFGANLSLGPLANNGGPTQTMLPQSGSPLINAGSNSLIPSGFTADQRGPGYARVFGISVDIGAVETQTQPSASASFPTPLIGAASYSFTVTYLDDQGLNLSTIVGNNSALRVTGPSGFSGPVTFLGIDDATNGSPRTASYSFMPPGGSWESSDNGTYSIDLQADQIADGDGNFAAPRTIGSFTATLGKLFVITNLNDNGPGSLRQALTDPTDYNLIRFQPGLTGTLTLTTGNLLISRNLTIEGPGPELLTIRRAPGSNFDVFRAGSTDLKISGLTISGTGSSGSGLVMSQNAPNVILDRMVFVDNRSISAGGGAIHLPMLGFLTISNSSILRNSGGYGGGINVGGGLLILENTIVSGNTATSFYGGGISLDGTPFSLDFAPPGYTLGMNIIRNSIISNNTAAGSGGGIGFLPASGLARTLLIQNSTITGNSAADSGGAISFTNGSGSIDIQNSTISGNTANATAAGAGGGGIARTSGADGAIRIQNSVVSGNNNDNAPDLLAGSATIVKANFSAIGSPTGFTLSASSGNNLPFATNLLLGPLANNGGPTQTMLPQSGSPLINAGSNSLIPSGTTTDQRGFPRIVGPRVDIGAAEYVIPGDLNFDGSVSISDFITLAGNFNKTNMNWTDGDLNFDNTVSIADFIALAANFNTSIGSSPAPTVPQPAAELSISSDTFFSHTRHSHHRHPKLHHPRPHLLFRFELH